jgi:serine/threonine protein kinase
LEFYEFCFGHLYYVCKIKINRWREIEIELDFMIGNKYQIESILSKGCYGFVYKGFNVKNRENVAIKIEINSKSLQHETKILNYLYTNKVRKIPAIYWYGNYNEHPCLVMTYYELNLLDYIKNLHTESTFSLEKVNQMMYKMVNLIMEIHNHYVVHRDLKPANFMIKHDELYLIDFGFASFYIHSDNTHIQNEKTEHIIGSPKYISINIFRGNVYSRRDDLISLIHIYFTMLLNDSPWENDVNKVYMLEYGGKSEYEETNIHHPKNRIRLKNRDYDIMMNYVGKNETSLNYLKYVYGLAFDEKPRYSYLSNLFVE